MGQFAEVRLADGSTAMFQTMESPFYEPHGATDVTAASMQRLTSIAAAAREVCEDFRSKLTPDELQVEIGVGLSGEVGWFFARSEVDASIKVTLTWKSNASE